MSKTRIRCCSFDYTTDERFRFIEFHRVEKGFFPKLYTNHQYPITNNRRYERVKKLINRADSKYIHPWSRTVLIQAYWDSPVEKFFYNLFVKNVIWLYILAVIIIYLGR